MDRYRAGFEAGFGEELSSFQIWVYRDGRPRQLVLCVTISFDNDNVGGQQAKAGTDERL